MEPFTVLLNRYTRKYTKFTLLCQDILTLTLCNKVKNQKTSINRIINYDNYQKSI